VVTPPRSKIVSYCKHWSLESKFNYICNINNVVKATNRIIFLDIRLWLRLVLYIIFLGNINIRVDFSLFSSYQFQYHQLCLTSSRSSLFRSINYLLYSCTLRALRQWFTSTFWNAGWKKEGNPMIPNNLNTRGRNIRFWKRYPDGIESYSITFNLALCL
jgi:hypothetical protein